MAQWLSSLSAVRRSWPLPRRRRLPVDPFSALEVQWALSRLDRKITDLLEGDDDRFARGHHLMAAIGAYGQALEEACELADIQLPDGAPSVRRVIAEAELRSCGWDW